MRLAIIPARGGSKRIPHKNIKSFSGRPMIAWSIDAAIQSGCFDRVIVSTDSTEIARVAKAHGADVPFMRPQELSDDYTSTIPVIAHAIAWQNAQGQSVSQACCIYATAPFVQALDIQRGLSILNRSRAQYAFSVTSYDFPIQRAIRINENGRVSMFQPEHLNTRSQDLEEAWHDAGQFYWGESTAWLAEVPIFSLNSAVIPLQRDRVQDIDTEEDWSIAEIKFKILNKRS